MKTFLFGLNISPPKTTQCTFNFEVQFNFAHDGFLIQNNWIHQEAGSEPGTFFPNLCAHTAGGGAAR